MGNESSFIRSNLKCFVYENYKRLHSKDPEVVFLRYNEDNTISISNEGLSQKPILLNDISDLLLKLYLENSSFNIKEWIYYRYPDWRILSSLLIERLPKNVRIAFKSAFEIKESCKSVNIRKRLFEEIYNIRFCS